MSYKQYMTSVTFRLGNETRGRLRAKAKRLGTTESDLLREIVERDLEDKPMGLRVGQLKASLSLKRQRSDWRATIRKRNWRP